MRLILDSTVYTLDAVKKAAYRFVDRFAIDIRAEHGSFVCDLTFPPGVAEADQAALVADFRKEMLDQDLRERISEQTAAVRNAILAVAFAPVTRGE
jgi:His-Xaa-Ser system protein HxsD